MNVLDMLRERIADLKNATEDFGAERIREASDRLIEITETIAPEEVLFGAAILTKGPDGLSALDRFQSEYEAKFIADPSLMHGGRMPSPAGRELAAADALRAAKLLSKAAYDIADMQWSLGLAAKRPSGSTLRL
jgi:hypothetical protein